MNPGEQEKLYDYSSKIKYTGMTNLMVMCLGTKRQPQLNSDIEEYIAKNPSALYEKNNEGYTPLEIASLNSRVMSSEKTVKILCESGADVNVCDSVHKRPLLSHVAIISDESSTIGTLEILLKYGAKINATDAYGCTAIFLASCASGTTSSEETVEMLCEYGANVNLPDLRGFTPLICASFRSGTRSTERTVEILLKYGADPNKQIDNDGYTALMLIIGDNCKNSTYGTIELLLKNKADLKLKNNEDDTALIKASDEQIVSLLLKYCDKETINLKGEHGNTALMVNCNAINERPIGIVKQLLENGADLRIRNNRGQTPLLAALGTSKIAKSEKVVNLLLKYGADVEMECPPNKYVLYYITSSPHFKNTTREAIFIIIDECIKKKWSLTKIIKQIKECPDYHIIIKYVENKIVSESSRLYA